MFSPSCKLLSDENICKHYEETILKFNEMNQKIIKLEEKIYELEDKLEEKNKILNNIEISFNKHSYNISSTSIEINLDLLDLFSGSEQLFIKLKMFSKLERLILSSPKNKWHYFRTKYILCISLKELVIGTKNDFQEEILTMFSSFSIISNFPNIEHLIVISKKLDALEITNYLNAINHKLKCITLLECKLYNDIAPLKSYCKNFNVKLHGICGSEDVFNYLDKQNI